MNKFKDFWNMSKQAVLSTLLLMLICGLGFPLLLTGISALIMPKQAEGSLVTADGKVYGSHFVGQEFTEPYFLKGRPSAVHYNTYFEKDGKQVYADGSEFSGLASGSQNLGPSNPDLVDRVQKDMDVFLALNPDVKKDEIPADLMTASGSGLDPHISPAAASIQLPGIAEASGLSIEKLEGIIAKHTESKLFGIFGEETVNVLEVNLEIAKEMNLI